MKISLVTVSYNSVSTIEQTIKSVLSQTYSDIEYVVVDSCSDDGTQELLKKYQGSIDKLIIEKDKGIYDAMNKGIAASSGDIIGIINSDDFYDDPSIIQNVINFANQNKSSEVILTDIFFINARERISRKVGASYFSPWKLRFGWMPPHPGMFIKKETISKVGPYDVSYEIASDFEYCLRLFILQKVKFCYLKINSVVMREGGISTKSFKSNLMITYEMKKALRSHKIYSNIFFLISRLPIKLIVKFFSIKKS